MRILLLGGSGQLGWELQRALAPIGDLVAPAHSDADLEQPEALAATVRATAPRVIVNAAAHTAVDQAESEPARAQAVNAVAPALLAREAQALDAWLLHFSTEHVFDGSGTTPWSEESPTAPLNVYGHSKLDGELAIRASGCHHLLLRTSWVYGVRGANFARTMVRLAAERERLGVVADQYGAPTGAELIADVAAHALRVALARPETGGTYHVAAAGKTNRYGYAAFVIDAARRAGRPVRVAPDAIEALPSSAWPAPARRPLNSRLDTRKLRGIFDLTLPPWQSGVARVLAEWFDHPA